MQALHFGLRLDNVLCYNFLNVRIMSITFLSTFWGTKLTFSSKCGPHLEKRKTKTSLNLSEQDVYKLSAVFALKYVLRHIQANFEQKNVFFNDFLRKATLRVNSIHCLSKIHTFTDRTFFFDFEAWRYLTLKSYVFCFNLQICEVCLSLKEPYC